MPLAIRAILALLPKRKIMGVIIALLMAPIVFVAFLTSSTFVLTNIPAIEPAQMNIYKDARTQIFAQFGLVVSWQELIAIDAVRLKQDFSKVDLESATKLARRFVREVREKDEDGNVIIYYELKTLDQVVRELIADGELARGDLERVKNYLLLPWDTLTDGQTELPDDSFPIPVPGDGVFVFPVLGQWYVSDVFRERINPVTGRHEIHKGIDLASPEGTPVVAVEDGVVIFARNNGSAGNEVKIDHGGGVVTRYLHLHSFSVRAGDEVKAGDIIGKVGNTGRSTGPHLHFELIIGGRAVDPEPYIF